RLGRRGVLIANDGLGMEIAARLVHRRGFPANLNGTDFLPPLLAAARAPVFLLGSRPGVAERAAGRLAASGAEVAGTCDGYAGMADNAALVAAINASGARILVAALGNPLQERWLLEHRAELAAPLLIGAGALLDFLAGEVSRAPAWARRARLEWLYRLAQEPRRLRGATRWTSSASCGCVWGAVLALVIGDLRRILVVPRTAVGLVHSAVEPITTRVSLTPTPLRAPRAGLHTDPAPAGGACSPKPRLRPGGGEGLCPLLPPGE